MMFNIASLCILTVLAQGNDLFYLIKFLEDKSNFIGHTL